VLKAHQLGSVNATTNLYQVQLRINPNANIWEGTFYHDLSTNTILATSDFSRYYFYFTIINFFQDFSVWKPCMFESS
jgi:hypothetical protein